MNYRSVAELTNLIRNNISIIPNDIDLIVGIPRSGMFVANYIALLMNKPMTDFDGLIEGRIMSSGRTKNTNTNIMKIDECKKILIIDDSVASGKSMDDCKKRLAQYNIQAKMFFCAIYVLPSSKNRVDMYFEVLDAPRLFEWNIFHQPAFLRNACFDIDGVLCNDPTFDENDDGVKYEHFIQNAKVKFQPNGIIGCLVTSRLEKYRNLTEDWLKKNGIQYAKLVMLNATYDERKRNNLHTIFKANYYKNSDKLLFVESEQRQAIEINNLTGKPVYCLENNTLYKGNYIYNIKYEAGLRFRSYFRRFRLARIIYYKILHR